MKTSQNGVDLIKRYEGYAAKPYKDIVGVLTWGYGHAQKPGEKPPEFLSEPQAMELLKVDLVQFEQGVERLVKVPLTQSQFDALVSFSYNLGVGNLSKSTLLIKLNKLDYRGASAEFPNWCRAGGKIVKGLLNRRIDEQKLFNS